MCILQVEISELKEQITMYESASQLGVWSGTRSATLHHGNDLEDSYAQLHIKKSIPESNAALSRFLQ